MKKTVSLVLILAICLSLCACAKNDVCTCECAQCAQCEKKTQIEDVTSADDVSETAEQNDHVIEFETPIVVAEDDNLRVELVRFYQDYYRCKEGYQPRKIESTEEDASLETLVVLKFYNKCDHELAIRLNDVYLGDDGATGYHEDGSGYLEPAAGKNVLGRFLIRSGEHKALQSAEELYSLDGEFYVYHKYEDGVLREQYEFQFSIPNGMGNSNTSPNAKASTLRNSSYLGKWKVTEIKFADEDASSDPAEDAELWESYLTAMLGAFDNVYFVFAESGDSCYHSDNSNNIGKWKETETGVTVGNIVLVAREEQLVEEIDGYLLYWEKVSDSQAFPKT